MKLCLLWWKHLLSVSGALQKPQITFSPAPEVNWGERVEITCSVVTEHMGGTFVLKKTQGSFQMEKFSENEAATFILPRADFSQRGSYFCEYQKKLPNQVIYYPQGNTAELSVKGIVCFVFIQLNIIVGNLTVQDFKQVLWSIWVCKSWFSILQWIWRSPASPWHLRMQWWSTALTKYRSPKAAASPSHAPFTLHIREVSSIWQSLTRAQSLHCQHMATLSSTWPTLNSLLSIIQTKESITVSTGLTFPQCPSVLFPPSHFKSL